MCACTPGKSNLKEVRFSPKLLRHKNVTCRCNIYTGAVEGATSAKTFHASKCQGTPRRHQRNAEWFCYISPFLLLWTLKWKPTELWIISSWVSLISPSCLCSLESNRHTEFIVGSKSWLIMTVNHQRSERWRRRGGDCCQTCLCATEASPLLYLAKSFTLYVQSLNYVCGCGDQQGNS